MRRQLAIFFCAFAVGALIARHQHREHEKFMQAADCAMWAIEADEIDAAERCFTDRGLVPPWKEPR